MSDETCDLPNEILQKIFEYVIGKQPINETLLPKLYIVCRKWHENYRRVNPRWKKLENMISIFNKIDIYDIKLFQKVMQDRNQEKIKQIRSMFTRYRNCNISIQKNEILIRISNPSPKVRGPYFSCVLSLKFNSFDIEMHYIFSTNAKIAAINNVPYICGQSDKLIKKIKKKIAIKLKDFTYSEENVEFLLNPTIENMCSQILVIG